MENSLVDGLVERIEKTASINSSVGVVLPSNNYDDFTKAVFEFMKKKKSSPWVYVTITKPYDVIKQEYPDLFDEMQIQFIDCVSHAAGIAVDDNRCFYLDSPSQLEMLILEIVNNVKCKDKQNTSFIVIDSLSSLSLFNDELLVTEFLTHLINHLRLYNAHIISLCVEEEMNDRISKMMYLKNEKILKIKESFI